MNGRQRLYFDGTPLINKHISGIGKVLLESLKALDTEHFNNKYEMYVFVPIDEREKIDKFKFEHIKVKVLPYPHKFMSLFSRLKVSPPIDIFLGRGVYVFENYRNWSLLSSKSITYIHDIAFKVYPEFIETANLKYLNKYMTMWIERADKVVTVSKSSKKEIEQQFGIKDVGVVANASDEEMYPRDEDEIKFVRKKWNIPEKYFLYFGNIEPRKNLVNTVRAFSAYAKGAKISPALVLIGGDGWNNEEIYQEIELVRKEGVSIIRPNAYVPDEDMPALLTGAEALLQLSWHEGFGMSVLHALACGVPVLASDIPPLREVGQGNEGNIIYVDPSSVTDITKGIVEVVKMPRIETPKGIAKWDDSMKTLESIIDAL